MYYVLGDHGGGSREGSSVFDRKSLLLSHGIITKFN